MPPHETDPNRERKLAVSFITISIGAYPPAGFNIPKRHAGFEPSVESMLTFSCLWDKAHHVCGFEDDGQLHC
jgi:hypothetical protein